MPLIEQTISTDKRIMYNWLNSYELLVIEDHKIYATEKGKGLVGNEFTFRVIFYFYLFCTKAPHITLLEFDNHRLPLLKPVVNVVCSLKNLYCHMPT